jgi:hypothetical protein
MKFPKRVLKATEISTSGSEEEADTRTYAEVAAHTSGSNTVPTQGPLQPPPEGRQVPPGPPRADVRRSPSPVAGGSGLQPPTAKSAKKRKREGGAEDITDVEARKSNAFLKTEMAIITSRAAALQTTLQEHQECLEEATNAVSLAKDKEDKLRAEHVKEMNRAKAQMDAMRETENRRALNAYYKARYRARQSNKDTIFKSSAELIIKCIWELIESLSTSKKLKTRKG